MGYTTDFVGSFKLSRPTTKVEKDYINTLTSTRRMRRDVNKLMGLYNGQHGLPRILVVTDEAKELVAKLEELGYKVELSLGDTDTRTPDEIYGKEGEFFCYDEGDYGQARDYSIIDYNTPPNQISFNDVKYTDYWKENQRRIDNGLCQPALLNGWVISDDGTELEWNGGEKFYYYTQWLQYMIDNFFSKWGIMLNGTVQWSGEETNDVGKIIVVDNFMEIFDGHVDFKKRGE